jgi:hypothetical protein
MIYEERFKRCMDSMSTVTRNLDNIIEFDSETGMILDKYGVAICSVDFNEDETQIITRDIEGNVVDLDNISNTDTNVTLKKEDIYRDWDYWKKYSEEDIEEY